MTNGPVIERPLEESFRTAMERGRIALRTGDRLAVAVSTASICTCSPPSPGSGGTRTPGRRRGAAAPAARHQTVTHALRILCVRRAFSLLTSAFFQSIMIAGGLGRRPIEYMIQGYCAASLPQGPSRGQAVASKERGAKPHANGTVSARTYRGGVSRWDESPPLQTSRL